MLKREVTYEDFDGNQVTDTFYFNLNRTELIEMEVGYEGGLQAALQRIIESKDNKNLIAEFKKIILQSYGMKSEDGKRFIKNDMLREDFQQTAAFDSLFMDLATNDNAAADFIKGILPKGFVTEEKTLENLMQPKSNEVVVNLPPVPTKE
jgi:hypothetical protein